MRLPAGHPLVQISVHEKPNSSDIAEFRMRLVQFLVPGVGRRVGSVEHGHVIDLTSADHTCTRVFDLLQRSFSEQQKLVEVVAEILKRVQSKPLSYANLLKTGANDHRPYLLAPLDHEEPSRVLITGTGLSHLGSVQSRDQMHGGTQSKEPETDSARMFAMGVAGGRPEPGKRGISPEWFYKGSGLNLCGPRTSLEIPAFALDGGEEPEIVGCYIIDPAGKPRRIGFALGNEWSDHATEKINYLYLAPSKLRQCSTGPSLQVTNDFDDVELRCTVTRDGKKIYDSGELRSGERNMCHSLANLEDHHFKYPQNRNPGDIHLHFFGTSRLSFGSRTWTYQPNDEIEISAPGFCEPLVNTVCAGPADHGLPLVVESV